MAGSYNYIQPPTSTQQAPVGYGSAPSYLGSQSLNTSNVPVGGGPNILGGGMYQGAPININPNAFNNAVGAQAGQALSGQIGNYLGATTAPVVAAQATGGPNAAYNSGIAGQQGLAAQYQQMAAGQGPSLAALQAQQSGQQNLANTESMLGSARGAGSPAAAQQAARNAQSSIGQQTAQNAVLGRTNEELGAMGAAGGLYGNIANAGLGQQGLQQGISQFNAGQANQVGMGNQSNSLAANTNYLGALSGINNQQQQGQIAGQQLAASIALGRQGIQNSAYNNSAQQNSKIFGSLMQGASGLAATFL